MVYYTFLELNSPDGSYDHFGTFRSMGGVSQTVDYVVENYMNDAVFTLYNSATELVTKSNRFFHILRAKRPTFDRYVIIYDHTPRGTFQIDMDASNEVLGALLKAEIGTCIDEDIIYFSIDFVYQEVNVNGDIWSFQKVSP